MALSRDGARQAILDTIKIREQEISHLNKLWEYRRGYQSHPMPEAQIPAEVRQFLKQSRVNIVKLVIDVLAQSLYVDGYRTDTPDTDSDDPAWDVWQVNAQDSRQAGLHRAAFTYGVAYSVVTPGDPSPVIRNRSPRRLTAIYGDDDLWPQHALEVIPNGVDSAGKKLHTFRLFDEENIWTFTDEGATGAESGVRYVTDDAHGAGVVPVVRYLNVEDVDDEESMEGEVEPLIAVQDQIDITTFQLEVTKHYQAFLRQYVVGWTTDSEAEKRIAAASRFLTFDDPEVKVGTLQQAALDGYIKAREASMKHGAIISQTPPHTLLGEMVNLSAEALAAAEATHRRKINEREKTLGEAHEQRFALINTYLNRSTDAGAEVRWQDTEARSLSQTVDALGKLAQMLNVPVEALWEMVPGVTQRKLKDWKALAAQGDSLGELAKILGRQSADFPA